MRDFTDHLRPSQPDGPTTLARERAQSSINVEELGQHLLSADGFLERQARVLSILQREPILTKDKQQNLSRPDRFKVALARGKLLRRLKDKHQWSQEDHQMAEYLLDDVSPYFLHTEMFVTTVREQGSEAQRAHWMPLIESWKIIGAYAQTELGHGSNVRGLELEARWDSRTMEFVMHSPTLTASKWWNGSLGRTANHAIVVAQLLLPAPGSPEKYVSHGPHPFIVQVRDMKTHQPLDGIVIGDIGPKYGYSTIDNAYMLFDNFRLVSTTMLDAPPLFANRFTFSIPHGALLSRYSSVDPSTGIYSKPEQPALVYGSMTYVRAKIVQHARLVLARATTIAVRYTVVRRQFQDRDGDNSGPELSVLDYPTVQIRILPLLATTFALHYTGLGMQKVYQSTRQDVEQGNFQSLAHMHSMSSGLKSLCTTLAADGIETCRRALGGHGFGGGSGLIQLNNDYLSKPTVEGDNWMITQQVAAYLIKRMTTAIESPIAPSDNDTDASFKELIRAKQGEFPSHCQYDILENDRDIVRSFQLRAATLVCPSSLSEWQKYIVTNITKSYEAYSQRVIQKKSWNSLLILLHRLSRGRSSVDPKKKDMLKFALRANKSSAQSQSMLVSMFFEGLSSDSTISRPTKAVLWDLYRLFALYTIQNESYECKQKTARFCPAPLLQVPSATCPTNKTSER
jgi:acyl-CoA oxidase